LKKLNLEQIINANDARKVYNVPFTEYGTMENIAETEKERAMFIWHQLLMKNADALLMMSRESINKVQSNSSEKSESSDSYGEEDSGEYLKEK